MSMLKCRCRARPGRRAGGAGRVRRSCLMQGAGGVAGALAGGRSDPVGHQGGGMRLSRGVAHDAM